MSSGDEIFRVTDPWGDLIVLTVGDWERISAKRPGVEGYVDHVRETLERPSLVFEGRYVNSKVFYREGLLDERCTSRSTSRERWAGFSTSSVEHGGRDDLHA